MRWTRLKIPAAILAAALFWVSAVGAHAHARLKRANPPVGGIVAASAVPGELQAWFSERVEPGLSELRVVDTAGKRVDRGDIRGDPDDLTQLRVGLAAPLAPGLYRVMWRAVSSDTHRTNGSFPFRVRAKIRPGMAR